jgi:hypothetical protein
MGGFMGNQDRQTRKLIEKWGVPFARALGEFVRAATRPADDLTDMSAKAEQSLAVSDFDVQELTPENDPVLYARLKKRIAARRKGPISFVPFDPAVPAKRAGSRLRQVLKARGVKQSEVARALGVTPSVISRVIKHPERSRLSTIRKIANAAGVPLSDLV